MDLSARLEENDVPWLTVAILSYMLARVRKYLESRDSSDVVAVLEVEDSFVFTERNGQCS